MSYPRFLNYILLTAGFNVGFSLIAVATPVLSTTNVPYNPSYGSVADSSYGWEFTTNVSIRVTHLGLFDDDDDGMSIDHPVGIFRLSDSILLTSGTISAGVGDTLIDRFRYVDTPDITLEIGETYVIAFYSADYDSDSSIIYQSQLSINPVITYAGEGRYEGATGGLALPSLISPYGLQNVGPNFLFELVPEPTTFVQAFGVALFFVCKWRIFVRRRAQPTAVVS